MQLGDLSTSRQVSKNASIDRRLFFVKEKEKKKRKKEKKIEAETLLDPGITTILSRDLIWEIASLVSSIYIIIYRKEQIYDAARSSLSSSPTTLKQPLVANENHINSLPFVSNFTSRSPEYSRSSFDAKKIIPLPYSLYTNPAQVLASYASSSQSKFPRNRNIIISNPSNTPQNFRSSEFQTPLVCSCTYFSLSTGDHFLHLPPEDERDRMRWWNASSKPS